MELTYSRITPEEKLLRQTHSVESSLGALSGTATAAVIGAPGARSHHPVCRASMSVSALDYGDASDEQLLLAAGPETNELSLN
jgi:hypothetical protein